MTTIGVAQWRSILDFIYKGEVLVLVDEMMDLQAAASHLKMEELGELCR